MGRIDKINQQVKREIGRIFQEDLSDPRLGFITITKVDVSPDLKNGKIHFSVLGTQENISQAQEILNRASGMIRKLLSQRMDLRSTPMLRFVYDESVAASARIEETLQEINYEHKEDAPTDQE